MRLRNLKETIPYTIEDTLLDVQPHSLEEPFHWYAPVGSSLIQTVFWLNIILIAWITVLD